MRIAQYLGGAGGTWGDVSPETINKGLGGRETAFVHLGEEWAKMGHDVISFAPNRDVYQAGARYIPQAGAKSHLTAFENDALVSWEEPDIFKHPEIVNNANVTALEMQVAHLPSYTGESEPGTDFYAVLSRWAGDFLRQQAIGEDDKMVVLPNGVKLDRYPEPKYGFKDNPYKHFYYSSSPDRGLDHVLRIWPRVREVYPGAKLHVCYGADTWINQMLWTHGQSAQAALNIRDGLTQAGVVYHGKVGQDVLAQIQHQSDALLYPCDTMQPTETGCITIIEAGAACTPVVTTNVDCLESEFLDSTMMVALPFNDDDYIDAIQLVVDNEETYIDLQQKNRVLAESREWSKIAAQWITEFETRC